MRSSSSRRRQVLFSDPVAAPSLHSTARFSPIVSIPNIHPQCADAGPLEAMRYPFRSKSDVDDCHCAPQIFVADSIHLKRSSADGKHSGCDQSYVGCQEFSFTLENGIYLWFQSFVSVAELESSIKENCPFKIDTESVYSVDPAKRHAYVQSENRIYRSCGKGTIF